MGKGVQKSETSKQAPPRKTKAAVDRRQNNRMLRQCPSGIAQRPPHHAIAVPTAMQNSHKDNVRSSAAGKQLKQRKSNSPAQHHLPALDLFWAKLLRESPAHLPPLDLAWTLLGGKTRGKRFYTSHKSQKHLPLPEVKTAAKMHHRCRYCNIDNVAFAQENTNETCEAIKKMKLDCTSDCVTSN